MTRAFELEQAQLEAYLSWFSGRPVEIEEITPLGERTTGAAALKAFGYGRPISITYRLNGEQRRVVLRRVSRNGFGRERASDRVAEVWRDFHNFNWLRRHVNALDMVAITTNDRLESMAHVKELLLLTDYVPGRPYADDLLRIRDEGAGTDLDRTRAQTLAAYLAGIHAVKHDDPLLWRRRLRDLVGHGEGIMGLTDSYHQAWPPGAQEPISFTNVEELQAIESIANEWRWRLKPLTHRLSQVHGDFHPFNVLFEEGSKFTLIDRSRGRWGEPADDVSCMSINYLFFSLQRHGRLDGPLAELYTTFWETYLSHSGDDELLAVIAPWFAWRALVLASPQWYPSLTDSVRRQLLTFAMRVMSESCFDWRAINCYLER
jgi:aminoglycoside phosphotransferase (APT) family kinase protein